MIHIITRFFIGLLFWVGVLSPIIVAYVFDNPAWMGIYALVFVFWAVYETGKMIRNHHAN